MAEVARDASQRQRRRRKRMSRDLDDHTNESLESPSSLPERVPLQEVVDGEKGGVPHSASNNSGDQEGSSGIHQSTGERRNRARRPRRRSRMENGDVYDGMETSKTLDMPEKKRYKRPSSGGVRHTRRSASAEMIDREDDEMMGDNENLSPARRRPRRKKTHGSKDVVNGEEYINDYDGYDGPGDPKRLRPKKHKTKKLQRQQNGTSAEEDNYNADIDGEASTVDYYKVDKEDIVVADTPETAPPALPPTAQTLPSQPLDVVFIERRDGQGFTRERKTRLLQLEEERKEPQSIPSSRPMTTAEFAVSVHRAFRSFSLFCHGLLAGLALCQVIFVYSLSNSSEGDVVFLDNYYKLAQPLQSLYYMLFAICTVSVFDRYDMANPRSGFFHGLLTRPSRILSISAYLFALVFSISVANIDDRISLYKVHDNLWGDAETSSLLETWRIINLMRVLGAVLGWVLVSVQPTKDYTAQNLYEGELLPGEQRVTQQRPANSEPQLVV
ncbi:transmembrane protein 237A-like isoform X1 [Orbicella faveolata]|uniref:transmembrane protein 237A-like isoform X1 n=1 Tax=Orbicella faveolata TaxID=48498 RepID=UPI0009E5AEF1|nr:transmembrane protein 237A-like isoform X1 [Orbicella faveolata]